MNSLIITNQFPPNYDGVGDYSYHLQLLLSKQGVETGVVTSYNDNLTQFASNIFPIIHQWNFTGCIKLYQCIKKRQTNNLLVQYVPYAFNKSGFPLIFILFIGLFRMHGIRIHANFHEVAIRFKGESLTSKIRAFFQRFLAYLLCCFSNSIQTSNKYYASLLLPFKTTIVPIPSNFEFVVTDYTKTKNENTLVISTNANRCSDVLLESIALLKNRVNCEIKLFIIGRAYTSDLTNINQLLHKNNLENNTSFFVNEKAEIIVQALMGSTIFIQLESVNSKGFGGVSSKSGTTAAAMNFGIPTITTCGDMTDTKLFIAEENICFVPFDDSKKIAEKILEIYNSQVKQKLLSKNAINNYEQNFAWSNTVSYHLNQVLK